MKTRKTRKPSKQDLSAPRQPNATDHLFIWIVAILTLILSSPLLLAFMMDPLK